MDIEDGAQPKLNPTPDRQIRFWVRHVRASGLPAGAGVRFLTACPRQEVSSYSIRHF